MNIEKISEARYIDIDKITVPKGFFDNLDIPKLFSWLKSNTVSNVVELQHGEWNFEFDAFGISRGFKCSVCKNSVYQMTYEPFMFCPHCGAFMKGDVKC